MPERRGWIRKKLGGMSASGSLSPQADGPTVVWKAPILREITDPVWEHRSFSAGDSPTGGIGSLVDAPPVGRIRKLSQPSGTPGGSGNPTDPDDARLGFVVALARWRARMDFEAWLQCGHYALRCSTAKLPEVRIVDLQTNDYCER